jgi:hypothetical protein
LRGLLGWRPRPDRGVRDLPAFRKGSTCNFAARNFAVFRGAQLILQYKQNGESMFLRNLLLVCAICAMQHKSAHVNAAGAASSAVCVAALSVAALCVKSCGRRDFLAHSATLRYKLLNYLA